MRKQITAVLLSLLIAAAGSASVYALPESTDASSVTDENSSAESADDSSQEETSEEEVEDDSVTCGDFRYLPGNYQLCTLTGYIGSGGTVKIPSSLDNYSVFTIGSGAFRDNAGITAVNIPQSVRTIESEAFLGCTGLTRVVINDKVTSIGEKAFGYADGENKIEGFVIEGIKGSAAETYAIENGFEFAEHHHFFGLASISLTASCTKEGRLSMYCTDCGQRAIAVVPKTPHRFTVKQKTVAPTLTSEGYTLYKCKHCDATKKLDVVPKLISIRTAKILGIRSAYTYTGSYIKPVPSSVTVGGVLLKKGTDYTISWSNNVNTGTATMTIKGIGKYTDTVSKTYSIKAADIASTRIFDLKETYKYTGKEKKPKPTISFGSRILSLDRDYTLSWSDNINIGTATLTVTGMGNFTGTKTVTFKIVRQGWYTAGGRTFYYNTQGEPVTNSLMTIDGSEYYFDNNGWMATSWQKIDGQFMFFGRFDGKRVTGCNVDGIPIAADGTVDTSGYNGTKIGTMMTAHNYVEQICKPTDSMETKRLKVFKWLFQFPYHQFRKLNYIYKNPGWENDFANDIFKYKCGCCVSEAAACAFMFHEIGYEDVYIAHDTAHGWVYMNGRVYDPLFAEAKSFSANYDVIIPPGQYRHTAVDMRKI